MKTLAKESGKKEWAGSTIQQDDDKSVEIKRKNSRIVRAREGGKGGGMARVRAKTRRKNPASELIIPDARSDDKKTRETITRCKGRGTRDRTGRELIIRGPEEYILANSMHGQSAWHRKRLRELHRRKRNSVASDKKTVPEAGKNGSINVRIPRTCGGVEGKEDGHLNSKMKRSLCRRSQYH